MSIEQLYEKHIESLDLREQCRLLELIARRIASLSEAGPRKKRSLMELHGLGAEIWEGIEAQEYVDELRREWDHRP